MILDLDDPYSKMKCFYLAKDLNNCLCMMDVLLDCIDEDGDYAEDDRPYATQQLRFDRDCLKALKKSSQGSDAFIRESLATFE
jgi:hypothetical protein